MDRMDWIAHATSPCLPYGLGLDEHGNFIKKECEISTSVNKPNNPRSLNDNLRSLNEQLRKATMRAIAFNKK